MEDAKEHRSHENVRHQHHHHLGSDLAISLRERKTLTRKTNTGEKMDKNLRELGIYLTA